ncbi:hypothetical protein ACXR2T_09815 [Leucobacter sp. HY1910]
MCSSPDHFAHEERYDSDEYCGDWWLDYPEPYEVRDRLREVERNRKAGQYRDQADYDAAYWEAEQVTPPHDRQRTSIVRSGLAAALPHVIDTARFDELRVLAPDWAVDLTDSADPALIVLGVQLPRKRRAPRWNSRHPIIQAITAKPRLLDGAINTEALAQTACVTLALTERTLDSLHAHPELLQRTTLTWRCLRRSQGDITLVPGTHDAVRADEPWFREPWRWLVPSFEALLLDADEQLARDLAEIEAFAQRTSTTD